MTIVAQNSIGTAAFRYLVVGVTCFSIGYIKGCEHGKREAHPQLQSHIEKILEDYASNSPEQTPYLGGGFNGR
jgi:hypothetical protein